MIINNVERIKALNSPPVNSMYICRLCKKDLNRNEMRKKNRGISLCDVCDNLLKSYFDSKFNALDTLMGDVLLRLNTLDEEIKIILRVKNRGKL